MRTIAETRAGQFGARVLGLTSLTVMSGLFLVGGGTFGLALAVLAVLALGLLGLEQHLWRWTLAADRRTERVRRARFGLAGMATYFTCLSAMPLQLWWSQGLLGQVFAILVWLGLGMSAAGGLYASRVALTMALIPLFGPLLILPMHAAATVYDAPAQAVAVLVACVVVVAFVISGALGRARKEHLLKVLALRAERRANREHAASEAKSSFLAVMGHEIRTPLNAVMGSAELLRRTSLTMPQREHVETMLEGGGVLTDLLNDLLDLSKIEAGRLEIEALPVSVSELAQNLERLWRPRASDRGLDFSGEVDPATPKGFVGDPTRVRQVLFNLISNAVKFTEAGGVSVRLGAVSRGDGRVDLTFSVRDTGCGMDAATVRRVFEPFRQADATTARRHGGTGLGLSICNRLAELMGGRLAVVSAPGEGSTFSLHLTAEPCDPPALAAEGDADEAAAAPLTILAVDDHPVNRRLVGALLQPAGHEVILASGGAEALALYEIAAPDVVLMDVQMPEMDGVEATRRLRAMGATVPIIALTGNVANEDRARYLASGMDDMVAKPIEPRALYAALSRAAARAYQTASATSAASATPGA